MIITHKIEMDMQRRPPRPAVNVVQDDKYSRNLEFTLTSGGASWEPPSNAAVFVSYRKPDGTGGEYNALPDGSVAGSIAGNVVTVALAPQVCTVPGVVYLAVSLVSGKRELHTFVVEVCVQKKPGSDTMKSEDYFKAVGFLTDSGWTPNMVLGTDEQGNVIPVDPSFGGSGIHIGPDAPEDQSVSVWIDTNDEAAIKHKDPESGEWTITVTNGKDGAVGPQGPEGPQGPAGPTGPQGPRGLQGQSGKSAFSYAQDGGYSGTEAEFAAKLAEESPKAFYVSVSETDSGFVADKTFDEIKAAYEAGRTLMAMHVDVENNEALYYNLLMYDGEQAMFYNNTGDALGMIMIDHDYVYADVIPLEPEISMEQLIIKIGNSSTVYDGSATRTINVTSLKNPNALTINGVSYDGSEKVDMTIQGGDSIPDYVRTEAERLAAVVQSRQNADTLTFIAASDFHYSTTVSTAAQQKESLTHMGQAMSLLREMVQIDFTVGLGDMVWDSGETVEQALAAMRFVSGCLYDSGIEHLRARGNHDCLYSNDTGLTDAQIFANIGAWNRGAVYDPANRLGGYCYKDFDSVKIRVICLNSCETDTGGCLFSAAQVNWLSSALDLTEKGDDWRSIILSHHPLDWGRDGGGNPITAINNAKGVIAAFHGHLHNYKVDTITGTSKKRIAIPNACVGRENEYTTAYNITWGESTKYSKTAGTANDTAFCVITIDRKANKIYADRYGAGYDRVVDYVDDGGAASGYTNLVPTSQAADSTDPYNGIGYKNGVYLSSSGGDSTDDTCVATGYIPYTWNTGNVIYVKGAQVTTASHVRIYGYSTKGSAPLGAASCSGATMDTYFTVEELESGNYYKLTPKSSNATGVVYLRLSLIGTGENLVVTVNEPIN